MTCLTCIAVTCSAMGSIHHAATGGADIDVRVLSDGVSVRLPKGVLRLQTYSDDVIRVRFTSPQSSKEADIPVILAKPADHIGTVRVSESKVTLTTKKLVGEIDRKLGTIRFLDRRGHVLLAEEPCDRLTPTRVAGLPTERSEAKFNLKPGEAIYGLGQHQQGWMNYVGTTVHLQQVNMEIAVPMMVSSQGYGLMWNNAAVTDVDVAGFLPVANLPAMLFDEKGEPHGLTARYYLGENFDELKAERKDPSINFNWDKTPPKGLPHDHYSVRWTGYLVVPKTGAYTIRAKGDDGFRVKLDGKVVMEAWSIHPVITLEHNTMLEAGRRYPLEVEYFQGGGGASVSLELLEKPSTHALTWNSEASSGIDYVFFQGPDLEHVIASYRRMTGAAPMFGRWAWGLWQSRERYKTQDELLDVAKRYRTGKIPLDGIVQDWQYWKPKEWGSHLFDASRYPDPAAAVKTLHAMNVHAIISVWAMFEPRTATAKELVQKGVMYPMVMQDGFQWYDAMNPLGRKTYWDQVWSHIGKFGWDGYWLDASEPELGFQWGIYREFKTALGPGSLVFNAYPLLHTKGVYEGQRAQTDQRRAFILTRSAYLGQQRNGAVSWSGDITANWAVLHCQVPAGLNFCLSGIPYWNTDVGGFFANDPIEGEAYQDLFSRWFQYSVFVPMLRIHGTGVAKEIWRWPEPTRSNLIRFDRLRYHLLPYIYDTSWLVTHEDSTMMRGLVLDFRKDPKVFDIADEFMFGPHLLVAPVTTPNTTQRDVYLPKRTDWVDFWTGKTHPGGATIVSDATGKIPIFVRAGAILPYGPDVQSALDPEDPTELRVYPGANGGYRLYNDAGDGYAYEHGEFATVRLTWDDARHTLTIGRRQGKYKGMPARRTFRIVVVKPSHGVGVDNSAHADKVVEYTGSKVTVELGGSVR